ncbi:hypothetical protein JCM6882_006039 [Rhodosporidiobolus microsporus]
MSSTTKREASPTAPSAGAGQSSQTPSKRPRLDTDKPTTAAGASSAAADSAPAGGEPPSSPFNPKDQTDSPSVRGEGGDRGKGKGKRGKGGKGGRGGKNGGGEGSRNAEKRQDSRSWGGRNTGKGEKEMRQWGKQAAGEGAAPGKEGEDVKEEDKTARLPKKKVAVLIGYNGLGFKGSQHNPGQPTIEGAFFESFIKAGAISEDNATNPQKVSLARAARTDAGVHAAINVISLKLILQPASMAPNTTLEAHLNSFLPSTMRVWSVLRVQGSFDPRRLCDQRQYQYTLPTHVLLGPKPGSAMAEMLEKQRAAAAASSSVPPPPNSAADAASSSYSSSPIVAATAAFWSAQQPGSKFGEDVKAKKGWRMPADVLEQARAFVKEYEGSHNYYNFTVGKDFRDRNCQRVMKKLEISDPFVVNDTEYISVSFLGQSFMLHQIRKMIGLFILTVRSGTPSSLVPEIFGPSRIHVPKAPGLGLLLVEPQYIEYNKRVVEANAANEKLKEAGRLTEQVVQDSARDTLDPTRLGILPQIEDFKTEQVYKRLWQVEEDELVFSKWLNYLDTYIGHDFEYLGPKGVIPSSATFKKGEDPEKNRRGSTGGEGEEKQGEGEEGKASEDVTPPSDDEGAAGGEEEG